MIGKGLIYVLFKNYLGSNYIIRRWVGIPSMIFEVMWFRVGLSLPATAMSSHVDVISYPGWCQAQMADNYGA